MKALNQGSPLAALRDFGRNPLRAGRELRDALDADSHAFLTALACEEGLDPGHRGFRYAMILLLHNDVLIPAISNPAATTFQQALRLTRCMLRMDCNFINSLLTAVLMRPALMKDSACTLRILDIVREFVEHLGNWRSITRIHQAGDGRIRMSCARLIAQYRFEDPAGLERFCCADPRVRANIIEMLWTVDKSRAKALLEAASQDPSNRVAGNAWLALYTEGHARSLRRLADMLVSREPKHRATAAWVMGQTRDSRFATRLLEASRSEIPELRKNAMASLARLEPAPPPEEEGILVPAGEAELSFVTAARADEFELWLRATRSDGEFLPGIRGVDFFVWADDELLLDYSAEELRRVHNAALAIVYPADSPRFVEALRKSIVDKPDGHCWALNAYDPSVGESGVKTACFEPRADALAALLEAGPPTSACAEEAVRNVLLEDPKLPERHLVLILDGWGPDPDFDAIEQRCRQSRFRLHVWRFRDAEAPAFSAGQAGAEVWCDPQDAAAADEPAPEYSATAGQRPRRFWEIGEDRPPQPFAPELGAPAEPGGMDAATPSGGAKNRPQLPCVIRDESETALVWPRFVASLTSRYVLRAQRLPTAVTVRDPAATPPRFLPRVALLKGGRNG